MIGRLKLKRLRFGRPTALQNEKFESTLVYSSSYPTSQRFRPSESKFRIFLISFVISVILRLLDSGLPSWDDHAKRIKLRSVDYVAKLMLIFSDR